MVSAGSAAFSPLFLCWCTHIPPVTLSWKSGRSSESLLCPLKLSHPVSEPSLALSVDLPHTSLLHQSLIIFRLEHARQLPDFSPGFHLPQIHSPLSLQRNTWKMKIWPSTPLPQASVGLCACKGPGSDLSGHVGTPFSAFCCPHHAFYPLAQPDWALPLPWLSAHLHFSVPQTELFLLCHFPRNVTSVQDVTF